jgi:hypothetical protein
MRQSNGRPSAAGTISRGARPGRRAMAWLALRSQRPGSPRRAAIVAAGLIAVAGLSIDAYVHLDLASTYAEAQAAINEGILFRAEAVLALLTAIALITSRRRLPFVLGFAVSASALTLMLVSRYVDLGPIGPFPDLYDPVWFPEKLWAAGGEAAAVIASVAGIVLLSIRTGPGRSAAIAARSSGGPGKRSGSPG